MSKMISKRFMSVEAVKQALKIDSFCNLPKEKKMQFASMIPYIDKEVAISIINQFPEFAEFGKAILSSYMQTCNTILEKGKESQNAVIHGYQTILDALAKRMDVENLSEDERRAITQDMIDVANKIAEADLQHKQFLEQIGTKLFWLALGVGATVAVGIGVHAKFGSSGDLPQLGDSDNNKF